MRTVSTFASCSELHVAAFLVVACGCSVAPNPSAEVRSGSTEVQPDMKAIAAVVEDAYTHLRQPASVFLGADGVEDTTMARLRSTLSDDLALTSGQVPLHGTIDTMEATVSSFLGTSIARSPLCVAGKAALWRSTSIPAAATAET